MNRDFDNFFPSSSRTGIDDFSFNSTAEELMAKFAGEEFQSVSRTINQLMMEENSWGQNYPHTMLLGSIGNEKECIDVSGFSGIIGDLELSLE